jgi:hypothetical protein
MKFIDYLIIIILLLMLTIGIQYSKYTSLKEEIICIKANKCEEQQNIIDSLENELLVREILRDER